MYKQLRSPISHCLLGIRRQIFHRPVNRFAQILIPTSFCSRSNDKARYLSEYRGTLSLISMLPDPLLFFHPNHGPFIFICPTRFHLNPSRGPTTSESVARFLIQSHRNEPSDLIMPAVIYIHPVGGRKPQTWLDLRCFRRWRNFQIEFPD